MNIIAAKIKQIVEDLGLIYIRSININDLNQQVGEDDIEQGVGVYSNLPEITNQTFGSTNAVLMQYSIEVFFLKLNAETDDKGEAVDNILNELYPKAQSFYDLFKNAEFVAKSNFIDSYDLDAVDTLKMTKEVLTGWRLRFDVPIYRTVFDCE